MICKLMYKDFLDEEATELERRLKHIFNLQYLEMADKLVDYNLFNRKNDQSTIFHKEFYKEFDNIRNADYNSVPVVYNRIIRKIRDNMFGEDIVYQTVPTFRVHLPGNVAVGEFHKDIDYGHNRHAINFWMPLTAAKDTSGIIINGDAGYEFIDMLPGDLLIFDAMNYEHGNMINDTGFTRMSMDFRIIPANLFEANDRASINTKKKFIIGDYYSTTKRNI